MKKINLYGKMLLVAACLFCYSCQKDDVPEESGEELIRTDISGVVQKGPFNVGTTVSMSELNEDLSQTGKTFITQINSDDGFFEFKGIQLFNPIVEVKADGFYFDEIKGTNSNARLTLNAIADVTDKTTLNVNVLTHLEKPRVEFLLENGYVFSEAKTKAKQEVFNIFYFQDDATDTVASDLLDITKPGVENACLLALSAIVQGYRNVADVSELLTYIANDLKVDGTLDDNELQTDLISHARIIDTARVIQNVSDKYNGFGMSVQVPDFGKYLQQFIHTSPYVPVNLIDYPEQTPKGLNILNENNSIFNSGMETNYSMSAKTFPGIPLKIELSVIEGELNGTAGWAFQADKINWDVPVYNFSSHKQTFELINEEQPSDLKIIFFSGNVKIQIKYIEGTRERTRIITII